MSISPIIFSVPSDSKSLTTAMAQNFRDRLSEQLPIDVRYKDHGGLKQGQELQALQDGQIGFATLSFPDLGSPFDVFHYPYLFENYGHFTSVTKSEFWKVFCQKVSDTLGITILSAIYIGNRQMASNELIRSPEDLKNKIFRVPPGKAWENLPKAFQATHSAIGIGDAVEALKKNQVHVIENPLPGMKVYHIAEAVKHISLTNHFVDVLLVAQSNKLEISSQLKKTVKTAAIAAQVWHDPLRISKQRHLQDVFAKQIYSYTPNEMNSFKRVIEDHYRTLPFTSEQEDWIEQIKGLKPWAIPLEHFL